MEKILFAGLLFSLLLISGCTQGNNGNAEDVLLPNTEIEASVVSLELDTAFNEEPADLRRPRDEGILRIERIINASPEFSDLSAGDEIRVRFLYSARPAKIIVSHAESMSNPDNPVSDGEVSASINFDFENGFMIYTINSTAPGNDSENVLSGVEEGDRIKTIVWQETPQILVINNYELI